jgi:hypothetical protein
LQALTADSIGNKVYYRRPIPPPPSMARYAAGAELQVTDQLALSHLAIRQLRVDGGRAAKVIRCVESAAATQAA